MEEEVSLMIDMAVGKKWDLLNMEINGNNEFLEESLRQINELLKQEEFNIKNNEEDIQEQKRPSRRSKNG